MIAAPYIYRAAPERVIDGDTLVCRISLGFHVTLTVPIRLLGIDTPERGDDGWAAARDHLSALVYDPHLSDQRWPLMLATTRRGKYEWMGVLYAQHTDGHDPINVNEQMILDGHARRYDGGQRQPWPKTT